MKKQVVIIGGGTTFDTYDQYISYLKEKSVNADKFKSRVDWKDKLEDELGNDFEIFYPKMPNSTNARYKEWGIWFDRMVPFLQDEVVLIGHSLGGIFLAKYLSENTLPVKIGATFLVAAPFDDEDGESLTDFSLSQSFEKFKKQCSKIYLLNSEDDPVVPFKESEKYKKEFPEAEAVVFKDRQHFKQESLPEIVTLIRNL
jgi:hypothetical protein